MSMPKPNQKIVYSCGPDQPVARSTHAQRYVQTLKSDPCYTQAELRALQAKRDWYRQLLDGNTPRANAWWTTKIAAGSQFPERAMARIEESLQQQISVLDDAIVRLERSR